MNKIKFLLFNLFLISAYSSATGTTVYRATVILESEIELTIEVTDVFTTDYKGVGFEYYQYGLDFNVTSRSLTGKAYNIEFNTDFHASLGIGTSAYGGVYKVSTAIPNMTGRTAGDGKQVDDSDYSTYPFSSLSIADLGLQNVKIVYWGTIGVGGDTFWPAQDANETGNLSPFSALPIELSSFTSTVNKGDVELNWSTASEKDNDYFTIERSIDGQNFDVLSQIEGAGNSSRTLSYNYSDNNLASGVYYYRLKQTDYDGKFKYYGPISANVEIESPMELTIYPNPSRDGGFTFKSKEVFSGELLIYNSFGQLIYNEKINNRFVTSVQLPQEKGLYIAVMKSDDSSDVIRKKLIVE